MRIVFVLVVVALIVGYFFWDGLFGPGEEDGASRSNQPGEQVSRSGDDPGEERAGGSVPESQDGDRGDWTTLLERRDWPQAVSRLESIRNTRALTPAEGAAYSRCLIEMGRISEARPLLDEVLQHDADASEAARASLALAERIENLQEKRSLLSRSSSGFAALDEQTVDRIVAMVKELNHSLPQSVDGLLASDAYAVQANDSLWAICNSFNRKRVGKVEVGLIRWLNGLSGNDIFPGQTLEIPSDEVTIRIWKKSWLLGVYVGDVLLAAYKVGLGRNEKTPLGNFVIESKLVDPPWNSRKLGRIVPPGDPENVLGTRWLGFKNTPKFQGYGIHGTESPDSIGKNMSDGCVRLLNEEVEEIFELVARGTPVVIH